MSRMIRLLIVALLASLLACGQESTGDVETTPVKALNLDLPPEVLGLKVTKEDVGETLKKKQGAYWVEVVGLFSMREGDLMRAALQVSRFRGDTPYRSDQFKRSVIGLIGGSAPQTVKVGKQNLYMTRGNQQVVFVWFQERGFFVLTTHSGYLQSRTLLRTIIDLAPRP
jgi:hypothetical protein